jgi:hypothetical protein
MTIGVYTITEIETGKIYVGQSRNVLKRWKQHYASRPETQFHYRVVHELLDADGLDQLERFYIQILDCMAPKGLNKTKGGNGTFAPVSDAARAKISEVHKGKKLSDEARARVSEVHKGKKLSDETKEKMRKSREDKHIPPSTEWFF